MRAAASVVCIGAAVVIWTGVVTDGGAAVVDDASVVGVVGKVTRPSPKAASCDGTSNFTELFDERVLLKTNSPVDSDIRKRVTPAVSEETPRCATPNKLKKTISVALSVGKLWSNLNL